MKPLLFLLFIILLVGCATYQSRPLDPSKAAEDLEARSMEAEGLREFIEKNLHEQVLSWPPESWDIQMLTLVAFYYHPDLDMARARSEVAKAAIITAGGRPNPDASFVPEYRTNLETDLSPWTLGFNLDIPVETAGKRGYRIAQARNLSEAARLEIASVAWRVRSRLRTSLLSLYAALERQALLEKQLEAQKELVEMLQQRLKYGEASQVDLTQTQTAFLKTILAINETQRQIIESRARVAETLGVPAQALDNISLSFEVFEQLPGELPPEGIRRMALLGRPDILAALAKYEASQSALQLEIARQYPDIRLGPGYAWDQGENKWTLGVSLALPIFNRNKGPIAEAEARRKEAEAEFISIQARALGDIDLALGGYEKSINEMETADVLLDTQRQLEQDAQIKFKSGETGRLSLLSAMLELNTAALSRLNALVRTQEALGHLEDALQLPLDSSMSFPSDVESNPRAESTSVK